MTTLILLAAVIVVTAAISASFGWLFGYNQAIRQHQASLSELIGKAKPSRISPAANDSAADKNSPSASDRDLAEASAAWRSELADLRRLTQAAALSERPQAAFFSANDPNR